ncbi:ankyrin repeat protein [Cordyceps javanica]|uniref:Ankyrin repeat protein n=1 Tax=Cordyceps javanica TaxID=43265 RepID=A0A545UQI9_9HYPO|nr:ankyrin repeat protein [Cordyceps javanica]TQW03506.1 ankyrin repeat protein [Cordyceps javanica]
MWDYSECRFAIRQPLRWYRQSRVDETVPPINLESIKKRQKSLSAAIALSWDHNRVTVLCPFCDSTHNHGNDPFARSNGDLIQDSRGRYTYNGPSPNRCNSRVSHCNRSDISTMQYVIIFPFEDDSRVTGLSFELQQNYDEHGELISEQFVTAGLKDPPPNYAVYQTSGTVDELQTLEQKMQSSTINDGDYKVVTKFECGGRVEESVELASTWAASAACLGDLQHLKQLLTRSPDPKAFVRGRDKKGLTLLLLAVPNGHHDVVKYLLDKGSDPNAADNAGRTPLMEAALWGHPSLVDILIQAGADVHRSDNGGMVAGQLAEESGRNEYERHERSWKYSEDPFTKKQDRKLIRALLGHSPPQASTPTLCADDFKGAYFHKSVTAGTISLVIPRHGIEIRQQGKTAAILIRGNGFPPVAAVSGRTGIASSEFRASEAGFERLDEGYWGGSENFQVADDIGFSFEEHACDEPGAPGSFNASHAEAQLMCFFVRRNYLFRYERDVEDDFLQLFLLQVRNRRASITVSKAPCTSCLALKERIREVLGIQFEFNPLAVR